MFRQYGDKTSFGKSVKGGVNSEEGTGSLEGMRRDDNESQVTSMWCPIKRCREQRIQMTNSRLREMVLKFEVLPSLGIDKSNDETRVTDLVSC